MLGAPQVQKQREAQRRRLQRANQTKKRAGTEAGGWGQNFQGMYVSLKALTSISYLQFIEC